MRTSCRVRSSTLAGALLLLLPAVARAEAPVQPYPPCERTPSKGDSAAAEGAFQAGNAAYGEADYDRAINYWEDAYRRDCTAHPMLLNLARAYEISGQKRHAVNALRTYLARNPNASDEGQIKRRIEKLDEQLQAESPAAAPPPPGPAQVPGGPPPVAPIGAPPPMATEQPTAPSGKRSVAPLIVVGVGGVATIVGGIIFFGARSEIADFEAQCPDHKCPPERPNLTADANAAQSKQTVGGVVMGVGLAAVAGGLIWYFVSKPSSPSPTTALVPAIGPGFGGANFVGSF
jgi:tetratricopeptide (TPR) repeat protein